MILSLLFVTIMPPFILYINQKDRPMIFSWGLYKGCKPFLCYVKMKLIYIFS